MPNLTGAPLTAGCDTPEESRQGAKISNVR